MQVGQGERPKSCPQAPQGAALCEAVGVCRKVYSRFLGTGDSGEGPREGRMLELGFEVDLEFKERAF